MLAQLLSGGFVGAASAQTQATPNYSSGQLGAMVAPVALYPDPLLTQVLIASAYPLDVIEASRWVDDPAHRSLTGNALGAALAAQAWDPSVKSLVPFPQILAMMNAQPQWMQQLGNAFSAEPQNVMAAVQLLRQQALQAGHLRSSSQQIVTVTQQIIVIQPAQPSIVYVPVYSPAVVYGAWAYPAYPPVYLPPPPGYVAGQAFVAGLAFGVGVAVTASLWNWATPDWRRGSVNVNVHRYNSINVNRTQINSWHGPAPRSNQMRPPANRPMNASRPDPSHSTPRPTQVHTPGPAQPHTPRPAQPHTPRPAMPGAERPRADAPDFRSRQRPSEDRAPRRNQRNF